MARPTQARIVIVGGSINLARTPKRWQVLQKQAALARSFGLEVQLITPKKAGGLYPVMRTDAQHAAGANLGLRDAGCCALDALRIEDRCRAALDLRHDHITHCIHRRRQHGQCAHRRPGAQRLRAGQHRGG